MNQRRVLCEVSSTELDAFVFAQVRAALLRPQTLLAGQAAVAAQRKPTCDELLSAELARLERKLETVFAERRRTADLYQAGFIEQPELLRRGKELGDAHRGNANGLCLTLAPWLISLNVDVFNDKAQELLPLLKIQAVDRRHDPLSKARHTLT